MFRPVRLSWLFAFLTFAVIAIGQQGAAGYGQGGGGFGGGGGGIGGSAAGNRQGFGFQDQAKDGRSEESKPEDEQGMWESRTAVLTPGDRVEYKFVMQKGETLLAAVTSDAFDPALSIVDPKGVELAKNDDREEGDQSPFLICRVPEAGTYTLKVLSYRAVSGGKFLLKFRSFVAADGPVSSTLHDNVQVRKGRVEFRLQAKKGKIYDLQDRRYFTADFPYATGLVRIIGPTGVLKNDLTFIATPDGSTVFKALTDGDFYLEYSDMGRTKIRTDYREVATIAMTTSGEKTFDLTKGELKLIEFPVVPDLLLRTTVVAPSASFMLDAPGSPEIRVNNGNDSAYGTEGRWSWFKLNVDSDADVVRIFHGKGTACFAVRAFYGPETQKVTIRNSESLPTWDSGKDIKDSLGIGESRLYLVKSTKSEFMRVFGGTSHFQLKMDIFRMNGELANSLMDRKTHTVHDDLYYPDAGTFVIRLSCDGHGGSGDYTMLRQPPKTTPYALGTTEAMKLDGSNFFLYTVNLEKGKRYELITDLPQRADLLDDDGTFLASPSMYFGNTEVQYFTPQKSGPHRLWLRGEPALVHFKLQVNVPPSVGK